MNSVVLESVSKVFRHRPALFNWLGRERRGETRALDVVSLSVPVGRVLVNGAINRVELWNPSLWDQRMEASERAWTEGQQEEEQPAPTRT